MYKKLLPLGLIFLFSGIIYLNIHTKSTKVLPDNFSGKSYFEEILNIDSDLEIQSLTMESTQIFLYIIQALEKSGFMRCDKYLAHADCEMKSRKGEFQKQIHQLDQKVIKTPNGFQTSDEKSPHNNLKNLEIFMAGNSPEFIAVLPFTGKNAPDRILFALNLIKRSLNSKNSCSHFLSYTWYFLEDNFSYEILKAKYGIINPNGKNLLQVYNRNSQGKWEFSERETSKFLQHKDTLSLKDSKSCE